MSSQVWVAYPAQPRGRCTVHKTRKYLLLCPVLAGFILSAGCATTHKVDGSRPIAKAAVSTDEDQPAQKPDALTLLAAAENAFKAANEAQETGNRKEAARHYAAMLEFLVEAEIDPSIFYNLRNEFERILQDTSGQTLLLARGPDNDWRPDIAAPSSRFVIEFPLHARVRQEIEEIREVYPRNFQAGLDRSTKYLPYIREEFRKASLPEDLVWLAMVESQFAPWVTSPAGAGGMWQFMPATGRRYGLEINRYVDERYNWQKATHAAIAFLTELGRTFGGDWKLAIASYNMGEGGMERAIAMNGGERDLWKLIEIPPACDRIQEETKKFYPKLLASILVAKNPENYGFTSNPQPPDSLTHVAIEGMYSLAALDRACGLPEGTLKQYNRELIKGVTPPEGKYSLAVPPQATGKLQAALQKLPKESPTVTHIVKRGETLSGIAKRYSVALSELQRTNHIRSARHLPVGKRLIVPGRGSAAPASLSSEDGAPGESKRTPNVSRQTEGGESRIYRVRRGDSLSAIAQRAGVSVADLQHWNNLRDREHIRVGQSLHIQAPTRSSGENIQSDSGGKIYHTVERGEYPAKIAREYGVPIDDLLTWNRLTRRSKIHVGDKLAIYKATGSSTSQHEPSSHGTSSGAHTERITTAGSASRTTYTVEKGECPASIASKHGVRLDDLLAWNKLDKGCVLHPGDELTIYRTTEGKSAGEREKGPRKITHTVVKGQNPTSIARRYGVGLEDLFQWNGWTKKTPVLHPGDKITIYAN
jgi:membrane-bound lytic murein transglycosylase D